MNQSRLGHMQVLGVSGSALDIVQYDDEDYGRFALPISTRIMEFAATPVPIIVLPLWEIQKLQAVHM